MEGKDAKGFMKDIKSIVSRCVAKVKCLSIISRPKTDAIKARLMVTTLTVLSNKKKISHKFHNAIDGITSKRHHKVQHGTTSEYNTCNDDDHDVGYSVQDRLALVLYGDAHYKKHGTRNEEVLLPDYDDDDNHNKYPDLTHTLFNEEEEEELEDLLASGKDPNANVESAIELVKNSKENFNLEDDIDQVADMFITKFHKRMRLQKLLSFKRHQQMMERSC